MSKLTFLLVIIHLICLLSSSTAWRRRRYTCTASNCQWAAWGGFGSCSASCGTGTQTRHRGIAGHASCGGAGCSGPSSFSQACNQRCCPVNCQLGPWKVIGGCSLTCGGGMKSRMREVIVPHKCGGTPCSDDDRFDTIPCNTDCCSIDCQWGSWTNYNACPVSCGGGSQSRKRQIEQQAVCGGAHCMGSTTDEQKCNTECCPVDCRWTAWGEYGKCSVSCGGGTQTRERSMDVEQSCGGAACSGLDSETKPCNLQCCEIDCSWGSWSEYGPCTRTCGGGTENRIRSIAVHEECGGDACPGFSFDSRDCNAGCCPVDCRWGSLSNFTSCSASCGGGTMERTRSINSNAVCGGSECLGESKETNTCNEHNCPIDCLWSDWSEWGECTVTCGGGTETRTRSIDVMEQYGGQKCQGDDSQTRNCNENCCAVECIWDDWSLWTVCSKSCEIGIQTRGREILTRQTCGGKLCSGIRFEGRICNDVCCPVDCGYSEWSKWGSCSKTCGVGIQSRSRTVVREPLCGGRNCRADLIEERVCNTGCCPVNCKMTKWGDWTTCPSTCGSNGVQKRTRSVAIRPQCYGTPCPENTEEMQSCNRICLNGGKLDRDKAVAYPGWLSKGSNKTREGIERAEDINECESNTHDCHEYSDCVNEPGSYSCVCKEGYYGNGFFCEDMNECEADNNVCSAPFMACEKTPGRFVCSCQESRVLVDGRCLETVTDLCEKGKDDCHDMASCKSTLGSYHCTCMEGFTGDGVICEDIDECQSGQHCNGPFMGCENIYGSFVCYCQQSLKLLDEQCVEPVEQIP